MTDAAVLSGKAEFLQKNLIPLLESLNPIFGELDFNGNVQLLYKHALHHLRQFGRID